MLKLFTTFAPSLGGHDHDIAHCHCRRHFQPSRETKRDRALQLTLFWGTFAVAGGGFMYHFALWVCDLPGAMRIP